MKRAIQRSLEKLSRETTVQQAGVVAWRIENGRLEFCLITGRRSGRWGFPKGHIEGHVSPAKAALVEAHEEAGLHGTLIGEPFANYCYQKQGKPCQVVTWLMLVESTEANWKESQYRSRNWFTFERAVERVDSPQLKQLLFDAVARIDELSNDSSMKSSFPKRFSIPATMARRRSA